MAYIGVYVRGLPFTHFDFQWEPITLGGLSFPSTITGTFLSTAGVVGVTLQLFAFPFLQRRVGTLKLYKVCLAAFPFVPAIMPLANWAARLGLKGEEHEGGFERDVEGSYKILVCLLGKGKRSSTALDYLSNMLKAIPLQLHLPWQ